LKNSALNINTFVFYIALIIYYLPLYALLTLHGLSIKDWKTEWQVALTAMFMNSSINPLLFCVERMEGVLIMAANTKALPRMDMSISGALRTPFMMIIVSGVELSSLPE